MYKSLLTTKQVAEMIAVTEQTVRKYIKSGDIKAMKTGKHYLVLEDSVLSFLNIVK